MTNLCIIPARGGSKRIPRKNMRPFCGRPIIEYSIEAALDSKLFSEVMVSTDDEEIAGISVQCGAKIPFFRSKENSSDFATTTDVIAEVIQKYRELNQSFETVCCIYPTAPFVSSPILREAYKTLQERKVHSILPIIRYSFPIQRAFRIVDEHIQFIDPKYEFVRSQDLEPSYHDAGQFYFISTNHFQTERRLVSNSTLGMEINELVAQDIDNEDDWKLAELKFSSLRSF